MSKLFIITVYVYNENIAMSFYIYNLTIVNIYILYLCILRYDGSTRRQFICNKIFSGFT